MHSILPFLNLLPVFLSFFFFFFPLILPHHSRRHSLTSWIFEPAVNTRCGLKLERYFPLSEGNCISEPDFLGRGLLAHILAGTLCSRRFFPSFSSFFFLFFLFSNWRTTLFFFIPFVSYFRCNSSFISIWRWAASEFHHQLPAVHLYVPGHAKRRKKKGARLS